MNNWDYWGDGVKTLTVCDLFISAASQQTKNNKTGGKVRDGAQVGVSPP